MSERASQKNSKRRILLIFIFTLLILNAVLIALIFMNNKRSEKEKNEALQAQKEKYEAQLDNLETKIKDKIRELKTLGDENRATTATLDSLQTQLQEVQEDRSNLRTALKISQTQVKQYERKIKAYEELLVKKDERVKYYKQIAETMQEKYNEMVDEKQEIERDLVESTEQIEKQGQIIDRAGSLRAENITINAVNRRGKEQSGGKYRSKDLDRLMVHFTVAENQFAKIGNKDVIMRVVEPSGTILYNSVGSGSFLIEGEDAPYSARQQILYDRTAKNVTFDFRITKDYQSGRHSVELYTGNGIKIGEGSFEVR